MAGAQSAFDTSLKTLAEFTNPALGLRYSRKMPSTPYIDVTLNAWALYVLRDVNSRTPGKSSTGALAQPPPPPTGADLAQHWSRAMSEGLEKAVNDAKIYGYEFGSWDLVARYAAPPLATIVSPFDPTASVLTHGSFSTGVLFLKNHVHYWEYCWS